MWAGHAEAEKKNSCVSQRKRAAAQFLHRGPERVKLMPLLQWRCKDIEDVSSVGCPQEVKLCSAASLQGKLYVQQQSWKGEATSIRCQTVS